MKLILKWEKSIVYYRFSVNPKLVTGHELFFAVSYSKPALVSNFVCKILSGFIYTKSFLSFWALVVDAAVYSENITMGALTLHLRCNPSAPWPHLNRNRLQASGPVWNLESTKWIKLQKQCSASAHCSGGGLRWTLPRSIRIGLVQFVQLFVSRLELAKMCKKLKSRNGFLGYL